MREREEMLQGGLVEDPIVGMLDRGIVGMLDC